MRVWLNMACSLDGRVAGPDGRPVQLSGPEDLDRVHALRADADAVLVGAGTVLSDDPRLTARRGHATDQPPLRVVLDTRARTPPDARIVDPSAPSMVVTARAASAAYPDAEVRVVEPPVSAEDAIEVLAEADVDELLVEGGPSVAASFLEAGLVDRFTLYLAPRILGEGPSLGEALEGVSLEGVPRSRAPIGEGVLVSLEVDA